MFFLSFVSKEGKYKPLIWKVTSKRETRKRMAVKLKKGGDSKDTFGVDKERTKAMSEWSLLTEWEWMRERERERPLVPQRDRLSHGLSEGSLRGELQLLAVYRQSDKRENIRGESRRRRGKGEKNKKEEESATLPVAALNCLPSPPPDRIYCPHHHSSSLLSPSSSSLSRPLFLITMPGWRRNLTFCLQRMHEEGRKTKQIAVCVCLH